MRKIEYTFTTLARQFMFIAAFLYILLHFIVVFQILIFKIDKYYDAMNFPLTFLSYFIIFVLVVCLFFQHRFFYGEYSTETLTYNNRLLHRSKHIQLDQVKSVICDTYGAYFYKDGNNSRDKKSADFVLPFFRGGRIDVVQLDKLLKYLQSGGVDVTKTYKIMPGYGKKTKFLTLFYGFIALCLIGNCSQPLYTVIVLFTSH